MLNSMLDTICDHPLLEKEEERVIGINAFAGCTESQEKLVKHNLKLVTSIAKKFAGKKHYLGDLISAGTLGLIAASKKYDPEKYNTKFSTFAYYCITSHIIKALRKQRSFERMNTVVSGSFVTHTINDQMIEEEPKPVPLEDQEKLEQVKLALTKLDKYDQYLLKARFGFAPNQRVITLQELGTVEGLTKERIRQKEVRALERLRAVYHDLP